MYKFKIQFFITMMVSVMQAYSQSGKPKQIIPLAPEAAEFAKYGNFPVSLITGTPNIGLPIYDLNTGWIKIPIGLSYSASGVQVNQRATWVGLGWSLNSGGLITRTIRGKADESNGGYFELNYTADQIMNMNSQNQTVLRAFADNSFDTHPDIFNYNLPGGKSGRFIFSKDLNKFQSIPDEGIEITRNNTENIYTIRDVDGKKYFFTAKQTAGSDDNGIKINTQSWYITKILNADQRDSVIFTYDTNPNGGVQGEETTYTTTRTYKNYDNSNMWTNEGVTTTGSNSFTSYMQPDEILFKNGKVKFYSINPRQDYSGRMLDSVVIFNKKDNNYIRLEKYVLDHDYFVSTSPSTRDFYRLRLSAFSKVNVNNPDDRQVHNFGYNNITLPRYNSTSQDFWGYYNGTAEGNDLLPSSLPHAPELGLYLNNNMTIGTGNRDGDPEYVKAGVLEKIIFPTKGYTKFNFEANRFKSDVQSIVINSFANLSNYGIGKRKISTATTTFTWPENAYTNEAIFSIEFSAHTNPSAIDVAQRVIIKDLTNGTQWIYEHTGDFTQNQTINPGFMLAPNHQYEIKSLIDDVSATYIKINATSKYRVNTSNIKYGGGLRIADITSFDESNVVKSKDVYTYFSNQGGANIGAVTRNDLSRNENYYQVEEDQYQCAGGACTCNPTIVKYINYVGSPTYPSGDFAAGKVVYNQVTKTSIDQQGKPNGKFFTQFQTDAILNVNSIYNPNTPGGRDYFENTTYQASQPIYEAIYKYDGALNNFKLVNAKSYIYSGLNGYSERFANVFRIKFFPLGSCSSEDDVRFLDYRISMSAFKLSAVEETNYNDSGDITTLTNLSYNNVNLLVNQTTKQSSNGKIFKTISKYPSDYTDASFGSDLLKNQFINDVVLDQTEYVNDQLVSRDITNYANFNGIIKPSLIQKLSTSTQTTEDRVKFTDYDYFGNLRCINNVGGAKTTYLYSYNSLYPIAEIKNADYVTIESVLGGSGAVGNFADSNPTDQQVKDFINQLRNLPLLKNTQITTFTYKPLVGMTSSTDAKGMTTFYEYDAFQRLKTIKDQNGNILKQTDYHYKN
jgi:YD repeat-containing protein